eukprot:TRINITY_DN12897_c0_g1_i1.p2 TRINITY_DN12897_c0_g1~~TRINITY_DN12897_c0_g1_i1.p2  ORF type:complete len:139 (-),score=27.71 TRINITY_DN12897_c0_g1_i1:5-421(-)
MQRGLVGSEMCIRDSINAEYMGTNLCLQKNHRLRPSVSDILRMASVRRLAEEMKINIDVLINKEKPLEPSSPTQGQAPKAVYPCLLYTSDAADDTPCVDLGGRRIIKKKNNDNTRARNHSTSQILTKGYTDCRDRTTD